MGTTPINYCDPGLPDLHKVLGPPDPRDVYLAPHSDDICFSLGALAAARRAGTLLTVFSQSRFMQDAEAARAAGVPGVTRLRMAEDAEFARRAGLQARWLGLPEAQVRGVPIFGDARIDTLQRQLAAILLRALKGPTIGMRALPRPWLFCPLGIGRHRDHLAVRGAVLSLLAELNQHYRVGFYEDLFYAADCEARRRVIDQPDGPLRGLALLRRRHDLRSGESELKESLLRIHRSQLPDGKDRIADFTPSVPGLEAVPHEAVWVFQSDLDHSPG